jgi:hypothetical protein
MANTRVRHTSPGSILVCKRVEVSNLAVRNTNVLFEIDQPKHTVIEDIYGRCTQEIELASVGDIDFKIGTAPGGDQILPLGQGGSDGPRIMDGGTGGVKVLSAGPHPNGGYTRNYTVTSQYSVKNFTGNAGPDFTNTRVLYGTIEVPDVDVVSPGSFEITILFRQFQ